MQIFHLFILSFLLFVDVTYAVRATAWLFVPDGKQPTVFDNDIDTGVKSTEDVLFHRFKYFFHLMILCEHCNDQKICLFYYCIYHSSLPNFYLQKNPDLIDFSKLNLDTQMDSKNPDLVEKNSNGSPANNGRWLINSTSRD